MATDEGQRKLTAILAADVVGYSRLMGDDERATVAALKDARGVFKDRIEAHAGRLIDTAGDSILAEFKSVVEAVQCAVEVQDRLGTSDEPVPDHRKMHFRIGINLGDIIEEDDGTIYGDGVNVAARLEALAEPGGVMVSESAHMHVEGKLDIGLADAGEHEVKNIAKPVRAYRVLLDGSAAASSTTAGPSVGVFRRTKVIAGGALALAILISLVVWGVTVRVEVPQMVTADGTPTDDPVLAAPTGPAIAVLPLDDLSEESGYEFFADGLTEDIITGLSRFSNLRVIARNSTFQYKGQAVDVREVGEALGVRYVLEGSVRRSGNSLRVSAQLLDARDGTHLWAENYARDLTTADIFAIQDSIMERIVGVLGGEFGIISRAGLAEAGARHTDNLAAYDCVLRAYEYNYRISPAKHLAVRTCLEEAVALDPTYAEAWASLAQMYQDEYLFGFNPRPDAGDPLARAIAASRKAIEADPASQNGHKYMASAYYFAGDLEQFRVAGERALSLNPNNSHTLAGLGYWTALAGDWDRGVTLMDKAVALNPNHPKWYHIPYTARHYRDANYDAALLSAKRYNRPGFYWHHVWLAMIYAQLGRFDEARASIAELNSLYPGYADVARADIEKWNKDEAMVSAMLDGLEKAGLFDEPEATRPVIAVLPFDNMSGDPEQDYFADGITEDIITQLSQFQELGVIARNSTFQYKGQASDVRKVGEDLNASHIVEGSIRRSADRIRVTVQLIDASDGNHLWSETYDRDLSASDIFDIQDDVTARVASTIGDSQGIVSRSSTKSTRGKQTDNLSSYECSLRWQEYSRLMTADSHSVAQDCLQRTVQIDPAYVEAWAFLAQVYTEAYANGFETVEDPLANAIVAAEKALALDPTNQEAAYSLADVYFKAHDKERFIINAMKTYELNPKNAYLVGTVGWGLMMAGEWERGFSIMQEAIELNPYHPGWWHYPLVIQNYINGDYDGALAEAENLSLPDYFWTPAMFAAVYAKQGRDAEAEAAAANVLKLNPDFANQPRFYLGAYVFSDDVIGQIMDGLRLAGMDLPDKPIE